jgi:hypothetical protein
METIDKTVDISVKNLAKVHARNRTLSEAAREMFDCLYELDGIMQNSMADHIGESLAMRIKKSIKQYMDIK